MHTLEVQTASRQELRDITDELRGLVGANPAWAEGALLVYSPHTTAGLTINEAADPNVAGDITRFMGRLIPREAGFHHSEGNSDAHLKASLFGPQVLIPISGGKLCLGTWQGVYLCEGDGPRRRNVLLTFLPGL